MQSLARDLIVNISAGFIVNVVTAAVIYIYWRHINQTSKQLLQYLSERDKYYYTVWNPMEMGHNVWVPQLLNIKVSKFSKTIIFTTTKTSMIFENHSERDYQWSGKGKLERDGTTINGSWKSVLHAQFHGHFHLEIKDARHFIIGTMTAPSQGADYVLGDFFIGGRIEDLTILLRSRGMSEDILEEVKQRLMTMELTQNGL